MEKYAKRMIFCHRYMQESFFDGKARLHCTHEQGSSNGGTVTGLREANKAVDDAFSGPLRGFVNTSRVLDWENLISCVYTGTSHANVHEIMTVHDEDSRLNCLGTPGLM